MLQLATSRDAKFCVATVILQDGAELFEIPVPSLLFSVNSFGIILCVIALYKFLLYLYFAKTKFSVDWAESTKVPK